MIGLISLPANSIGPCIWMKTVIRHQKGNRNFSPDCLLHSRATLSNHASEAPIAQLVEQLICNQ